MVHLIHRKRVPLLHNTVLILCNEGDGLMAVNFADVFDTKLYLYNTFYWQLIILTCLCPIVK